MAAPPGSLSVLAHQYLHKRFYAPIGKAYSPTYYSPQRPWMRKRRRAAGFARTTRRRRGGQFGKRRMTEEKKFSDSELAATAITATWAPVENATMDSLAGVAQGVTESTHIGRVLYIHSIHVNGQLTTASLEAQAAPAPEIAVRMCILLDKQSNNAQMTGADAMDTGQTEDVIGFRNLQNSHRFRFLYNRKWIIIRKVVNEGAVNSFAAAPVQKFFSMNHRFNPPLKVITSGTGSTIADITDNSIHLIACASTTSQVLINYQSRVRFTD